jgi:hypothetical protein
MLRTVRCIFKYCTFNGGSAWQNRPYTNTFMVWDIHEVVLSSTATTRQLIFLDTVLLFTVPKNYHFIFLLPTRVLRRAASCPSPGQVGRPCNILLNSTQTMEAQGSSEALTYTYTTKDVTNQKAKIRRKSQIVLSSWHCWKGCGSIQKSVGSLY